MCRKSSYARAAVSFSTRRFTPVTLKMSLFSSLRARQLFQRLTKRINHVERLRWLAARLRRTLRRMEPRKRIGIVGCGAIGRAILRAVDEGRLDVSVGGVTSRTETTAREFIATLKAPVPLRSRSEVIAASDLVIEAAGGHVVDALARETFAAGKDLMVISIGALL